MEYPGIEKALKLGHGLHAFRSGGGLRVVRIETKGRGALKGYGESPVAEYALKDASEDFLAGGRPYKEVYGKKQPHYLTGSSEASGSLDGWLLRGHTFDARRKDDRIVFELKGLIHIEVPAEVAQRVGKTGKEEKWAAHGRTFSTFVERGGVFSVEISSYGWFRELTIAGRGKTFAAAMANAMSELKKEMGK